MIKIYNYIKYRLIFFIKYKTIKPIKIINEDLICVSSSKGNYLINRRCPHQGAFLEKAYLNDNILICHWHGCRFIINKIGEKI